MVAQTPLKGKRCRQTFIAEARMFMHQDLEAALGKRQSPTLVVTQLQTLGDAVLIVTAAPSRIWWRSVTADCRAQPPQTNTGQEESFDSTGEQMRKDQTSLSGIMNKRRSFSLVSCTTVYLHRAFWRRSALSLMA